MNPEEYLKEDFEATGHSRYTVDGLEKNDPDGWTRQLLEKGSGQARTIWTTLSPPCMKSATSSTRASLPGSRSARQGRSTRRK
ncbi:hypothetical protein ACXO4A_08535 [Lactobacillus delbrueckii subsp. bulgaricus]